MDNKTVFSFHVDTLGFGYQVIHLAAAVVLTKLLFEIFCLKK